jgi:Ca-activated chloride channel family protein
MKIQSHDDIGRSRSFRLDRRGAIIPLFAVLLPVIVLLCGFAINVAYMQLTRTELRVATDISARAAGRAFSEFQSVQSAKDYAVATAPLNAVAGEPLALRPEDATNDIEFGLGTRSENGFGRYVFQKQDTDAVIAQTARATAVRINGRRTASDNGPVRLLLSGFGPFQDFAPQTAAVAQQVDRDIALILDRSGSMAWETIDFLQFRSVEHVWVGDGGGDGGRGRGRGGRGGDWETVYVWDPPEMEAGYILYQQQYAAYENGGPAPDASRWGSLLVGVNAFLDVLDATDQQEQVSVATFSTGATLDLLLQTDFDTIRTLIEDTRPEGWTAIGQGMETGLPSLYDSFGRPYAAKTIVVLTDGENNQRPDPVSVAQQIVAGQNVTIHTVTFSDGADKEAMAQVAQYGGGKHYHADDTSQLVEIFREIANSLPTIISQ